MSQQILVLALVQVAGMISPGPTAVLMLRNSAVGGRHLGYSTAVGITAATVVHVAASAAGLAGLLLRNSQWATGLRYAGAAYLAYLGGKILAGLVLASPGVSEAGNDEPSEPQGAKMGFRQGFLTNLLNPKVTLLYLALFGQLARNESSHLAIAMFAGVVVAQSLGYWLLFAALTGGESFRLFWSRWSRLAEIAFALALLGFGVQLLFEG